MLIKSSVVPVLTLDAYVAKDNVGGLLEFAVSSKSQMSAAGATIKRLSVIDAAIQDEPMFLHLFTAEPETEVITDADECVMVAADLAKKIVTFVILKADFDTFAGDSIASYELDTAIVFDGLTIYAVLEAADTPDFVAEDDLTINLIIDV